MSNDVFISYSHRDLAFVSQLHQELKQRGVSVWFDQTGIKAGDQRREKIAKSIMECKLFLL
ncbi:MAG TPA: toll/interleukin-1 receptor domain-containing protein, partial [Chloroflexi bacterium]|nr:toll/interleukin-1 receptor domain-containing protein [Chloroflexota bacterium]